jgi:CRISPR-associated endonuclease/helicase Cas3
MGKLLAYAIAGHHAGLPDGKENDRKCLTARLDKTIPDYSASPNRIRKRVKLDPPPFTPSEKRLGFQLAFFIRMIFSCLVDADFLDTEQFMDREKSSWRMGYPPLAMLEKKLTPALKKLSAKNPSKQINSRRAAILKNCLDAAETKQGLFSLTVPTGGGKTLSSLAFAMKHALKHDLKRIIYVIPFTSIIEQNAGVFREILGEDAVLEHHSNFDPKEEDHRSRLASENWDAPVIVTTNVQFFESLFSNRSSKCRRIHNIADSVVILDEAQMLPVQLLKPCLEALRELSSAYRTTIVLCTATQPALSTTEGFKDGLENVREIVPDAAKLYNDLKRVRTTVVPQLITDDELASRLAEHEQVLCIVNTRGHARSIFEKMLKKAGEKGSYHLSALICPAHRTRKLKEIKNTLNKKQPCRVVSTQLIEAGVDIDFPVVFRSSAGIDSIAQAAGRCNREDNLPNGGQVYIFSPETGVPPGHFRQTAQAAETVIKHHDDPLSLEAVCEYFRTLYWARGDRLLDEYQILDDLSERTEKLDFPFRKVDKKFKLITDDMKSVIIPWKERESEAEKLINNLRFNKYPAKYARMVQPFTVQIRPREFSNLMPALESIHDQYYVLRNMDLYREDLGLCPEDPTFHRPESLQI